MDKKETLERLDAVLQTLNNIDVRGKMNMTNMVGCIQILERIAVDFKTEEDTKK